MTSDQTPLPSTGAAAVIPSRTVLKDRVTALIANIVDLDDPEIKHDYQRIELGQYAKSYLIRLISLLEGDSVIARGVARHILDSEVAPIINESVHFYPLLGIEDYAAASSLIRSLGQYDEFISLPDLSTVAPEVQNQCLAVMKATRVILENSPVSYDDPSYPVDTIVNGDWSWHVINDDNLVKLIIENPQDAERIAYIVSDYQTTDPNTILGIMHGVTLALAEGMI